MEFYGLDPIDWHFTVYGITLHQEGMGNLHPSEYIQTVKTAVARAFAFSGRRSLTIDCWGLNVGVTPSGIAIGMRGYPRDHSLLLSLRDSIESEVRESGHRFDEGFRLRLITYSIGLRVFPKEKMNDRAIGTIADFMEKYADTYFGTISQINPSDITIRKGAGPALITIEESSLTS